MNKMISKTLMAAAVTAAMGFGSFAMAQTASQPRPVFTVDEGSVLNALDRERIASRIVGGYTEVISFTAANPTSGTFDVALKWNAGQFFNNAGVDVGDQFGSDTANQYGLYALYAGQGTYQTVGTATTFNFTPGSGSLQLYIDENGNTQFNQPLVGSNPFTTVAATAGDDYLIASGIPTFGEGTLNPNLGTCGDTNGINCGSFGATSTFVLNDRGEDYFTAPNPFYNLSFQSGQLNNFTPTGDVVITGSLDVVFGTSEVPEPASIALIGLGLLGLGMSRRRKQA